jgi:methionine-rich copper-binding protein CopC
VRRWLAAAASVALATGALAHAFVDRALPAVGSTVHGSPAEVRIWFTEQLESAFSSVKVEDAGGNVIAASEKAVDASDSTLLRLPLPPLAPGKYRVVWRVLSVDSHVTSGDYTFDVEP